MKRVITSAMDVLAVVMVAAGVTGGLWPWCGWWALAVGGVILGGVSFGWAAIKEG